ncbi:MAG TPA: dihydroneopterin aldolase [Gemmatimonadaceae bacterium]|nr:dihydroneopterin aldolase [Gemmatimonadaceae bacterium]
MAKSDTSKKTASATSSVRGGQTDVVTLKAMRFHARIGVLPHEAEIAQSIEVDASLWVRRGGAKPTTKDIVDYRRVYDLVAEVVTRGHINFLEEVGERIAERALQVPLVERVRIAVRKPNVALPGPLAYAEVALERERA